MTDTVSNTFKTGDCVLAYCDGGADVRAICWIVREDEPGAYIALIRQTGASPRDVPFKLVTARDPMRFEFHDFGDPVSSDAREHVSAAIRALVPFMR